MVRAVVTKKGRILQNKQLNGADLTFTRVVSGSSSTPIAELMDKTSITSIVQTLPIQKITQNEEEQSYTILVLLENTNLQSSYNLNQIGFYTKDPDEGEILFAIAQFDTPKKIETPNVEPGYTLEMPFTFQNSNNANVTVVFDPDNLMSRAGVEAMLSSEEISGTESGNVVAVSDSADSPFLDFKLFGKSEQVKTNGYQLFDASKLSTKTQGGATTTNNGDGSFSVTGSGALSEGFGGHLSLTHEETMKLLRIGDLTLDCGVRTYPYFYAQLRTDEKSLIDLSNTNGTKQTKTITEEILATEGIYLRFGFYGSVGTNIKTGTIKPMVYQDGDGTWEPFSGGKPSPSPNFPQEIDNTGKDGSIDLNVQGKNLWTVNNTNENLTYDPVTQIMTINGPVAQTLYELPIPIPKGTNVSISAKVISGKVTSSGDGGLAFGGYHRRDKYGSWQCYINIPKCSVADLTGQEYSETFEITEEVTHFYAFAYAATASIHEPLKVKVQYEINYFATDFEPNKAGQMVNVPLPVGGMNGIPVSDGGNYTDKAGQQCICDEINLAKRKYIQRIGVKTFVGAEEWYQSSTKDSDKIRFEYRFAENEIMLPPANNIVGVLMSNQYIATSADYTYMLKEGISIHINSKTHGYLHVYNGMTNTTEFKALLAENPLIVYYALATPIETDLTDEQMEALESLMCNESNTTILMDSIGNMEVTYFRDTTNGKAMGMLKSEHLYLKNLIGDINSVVKNLIG